MAFNTDKASSFAFVKLLKEKLGGEGGSTPDASSSVKGKLLAYAEKVLSPITASTYNAEYINTALDDISTSINSKADTSTVETLGTEVSSKAPIAHASSTTEYGVADDDNYGHVKLQASSPFKGNEDVIYKLDGLTIPLVAPEWNYTGKEQIPRNYYCIGVGDWNPATDHVYDLYVKNLDSLTYTIEEEDNSKNLVIITTGPYIGVSGKSYADGTSVSGTHRVTIFKFSSDGIIQKEGVGLTLLAMEKLGATISNDGIATSKSSLNMYASPYKHTSTTGEYGMASPTEFGHVVITDDNPFNALLSSTIVPTRKAIYNYCAPKSHAHTTSIYGAATQSYYGHVKIRDTTPFGNSSTDTAPTVNAINTYCMPKDSASYKANTLDWSNIERVNIDELFTVDVSTVADKMSSQPLINEGLLYRNIDNPQLMSFIKPWECLFSLSGQINIADLIKLNSSLTNTAKLISVMEYNPDASYSPSNLFLPNQINTIAFGEDLAAGTTAARTGLNSYVHIRIDFILNEFTTN